MLLALALCGCRERNVRATSDRDDRAARSFDRYRRPDLLVAALGLHDGDRVADLGAATGYLTLPIARAVGTKGRVVATDIDEHALAVLRARATEISDGATIEARRVSPDQSGLGDEPFNLILLCEVDHLLPHRVDYLARLRKNLAPRGHLAVCNRRFDRAALLSDAKAAGYFPTSEYDGLPAHFLILLGRTP